MYKAIWLMGKAASPHLEALHIKPRTQQDAFAAHAVVTDAASGSTLAVGSVLPNTQGGTDILRIAVSEDAAWLPYYDLTLRVILDKLRHMGAPLDITARSKREALLLESFGFKPVENGPLHLRLHWEDFVFYSSCGHPGKSTVT